VAWYMPTFMKISQSHQNLLMKTNVQNIKGVCFLKNHLCIYALVTDLPTYSYFQQTPAYYIFVFMIQITSQKFMLHMHNAAMP